MSFCATVHLSLKSLNRYETKSTVLTIERDHYYWNTSLPSFTICPVKSRIDLDLFDSYCEQKKITGTAKDEFYEFIESLANASYESFDLIKHYDSVDVIFLFFNWHNLSKKKKIIIFFRFQFRD